MNRFDYIKYDEISVRDQEEAKKAVQLVERTIEMIMNSPESGRYRAMALSCLEEVYMWIGKGIRNEQVARNAKFELQEERVNS